LSIHIYFTDINNVIYNSFQIRVFPKNIFDRCWIARSNFRRQRVSSSSQLSFLRSFSSKLSHHCWLLLLAG
jgi:hypothetical protein